jgi:hypothetical protein
VKAARGEAFPHEGAGNRLGRHRRAAGWVERPRPSGERGSGWLGKKVAAAEPKDRMGRLGAGPIGPTVKEKFFFG